MIPFLNGCESASDTTKVGLCNKRRCRLPSSQLSAEVLYVEICNTQFAKPE